MSRHDPRFPPDDALAHDARLRAALRHAPDADLAPPPALSAAISAAAHAALRAAAPPVKLAPHQRLWRALQVFWHDLSAPRPVWAGGAAAVVVAGLTMSLWINEQTPPAVVSEASPPAPRELSPESARQGSAAPAGVAVAPAPVPTLPLPLPPAPAPAAMPAPAAEPAPAKPDLSTPQPADTAKRARPADALADRDARQAAAPIAAPTAAPAAKQAAEPEAKAKAAKAEQPPLAADRPRSLLAQPREQDAAPPARTRGSQRAAPDAAVTGTREARSSATGAEAAPAPPAGPAPVPPQPAVAAAPPPAAAPAPAVSPPRPATNTIGRTEAAAPDKLDALAKPAPTPFPAAPTMPAAPAAPAPPVAPPPGVQPVVPEARRAAEALPGTAARSDSVAGAMPPARIAQAPQASADNRAAMRLAAPGDRPPSLSALLGPNAASLTESERSALQVLDGLTRQRWQRQPGAANDREAVPRQQFAPSGLRGLRIDADGAHWSEADGSRWFAPLDPAAVTRLRGLF